MTFHDLPQQADIAARLAPIRAHFIGTLGQRRDRFAAFCAEPVALPDPSIVRQLQEDAHKVRGVALTLGFDALGRTAGIVDELLNPWIQTIDALPVDAGIVTAMNDFLVEIERAITTTQ